MSTDPPAAPPSSPAARTAPPAGAPRGAGRRRRRSIGLVGWSVAAALSGLLVFYAWRTASNREDLTERNLRELDRIGRSVEGLTAGFATGIQGWYLAERKDWKLIPYLLGPPEACAARAPGVSLAEGQARFCYHLKKKARPAYLGGTFTLAPLEQALHTELFDATLLADEHGRVFLTRGRAGLRLHAIPLDSARAHGSRISTVEPMVIAGREYRLFLQPLSIRQAPPDSAAPPVPLPASWAVGGLVSTARFRADSLELGPRHLIFLGLLIMLAVLALPFVRAALLGPWESIKLADVHLLSISLVLASGLLGVALADLHYFGTSAQAVDRNLAAAGDRLAAALHEEIGRGLRELNLWGPHAGARTPPTRTRIFQDTTALRPAQASERHLHFQMITWIDPAGMQVAKWTPRASNTRPLDVRERDYFRSIREEDQFWWPSDTAAGRVPYFLESIRSMNTGEKIAALSTPYCWQAGHADGSCPGARLGVKAMITPLVSLERQLLPPGVQFAVVRDSTTLFHSNPERNLVENFLEETDETLRLHALLAARERGSLSATYMGRRSRIHVQPLEGSALALVMVLDEGLLGTAHFEGIFLSLAVFLAWAFLLWAGFCLAELLLPGRLRWAWPDLKRPWKYRELSLLLAGFALLLLLQAVLAATVRMPVHPSSFLVPIQALAVALLVQAAGAARQAPAEWRRARAVGWSGLWGSAIIQLWLHASSESGGYHLLLSAAQLGMTVLSTLRVRALGRHAEAPHRPAPLQQWYVGAIVMTLAAVALLPAYLVHQEAYTQQRNRVVRYEQEALQHRLGERSRRIRALNRDRGLNATFDTVVARDTLDLAVPPVLGARYAGQDTAGCRVRRSELASVVFSRIARVMPFVTSAAVELRERGPESGTWRVATCSHGVLRVSAASGRAAAAVVVPRTGEAHPWRVLLLAGMLAAGLAALYGLARWLATRIFLLDVPGSRALTLKEQLRNAAAAQGGARAASLVAICTRSMDRRPLRRLRSVHYIDLHELAGSECDVDAVLDAAPKHKLLVLDHFDHRIDDAEWSGRLLLALETQLTLRERRIVIMTSREPCALFPLAEQTDARRRDEAERWVRLLGHFVDVAVPELAPVAVAAGGAEPATEAERALRRECRGYPRLATSALQVSRHPDFPALTGDAVIAQLRELADSHYHALWSVLEHDEQLIVAQLAQGVVVNPKSKHAVRQLLARNILVRDPELRLMNDSFARFVQEEVPAATIAEWEREEPSSAWQRLRFPISFALVGVVAFLFVTQRGAFDSAVAVATGAGVGISALIKLYSLLPLPARHAD